MFLADNVEVGDRIVWTPAFDKSSHGQVVRGWVVAIVYNKSGQPEFWLMLGNSHDTLMFTKVSEWELNHMGRNLEMKLEK
jgi:hypothetical protein